MSKRRVGAAPRALIAVLFAVEPPAAPGGRPEVPDRRTPMDVLADHLFPAFVFGTLGMVSCFGTLSAMSRSPADPTLFAGLARWLNVAHAILISAFCGLIATLFLTRRAPRGGRASPLATLVALAGTFGMSAIVVEPSTTQDQWVFALADLLLTVGLAFSIAAAASLRDCFALAAEARGVVTTGAYRLVRHPLYLGELVGALGALWPVLSPLTALIFASFCLCQITRARLEERVLAAQFPEYAAYRRRTPALIPWPRPRPS